MGMEISEEEYESLKADKKRLDFLEDCHTRLNDLYKTDYGWEVIINHNVVRLMKEKDINGIDLNDAKGGNDKIKTCRLALDKKMEEIEFQRKALNKKLEEDEKRKEFLDKMSNILKKTGNTDMLGDLEKYK